MAARSRISWSAAEVRLPSGDIVTGRLHWRASTGGATLRTDTGELHTLTGAFEAVELDATGEHRTLAGNEGTWEVRWVDYSACASCSGRKHLT